MIMIILYLSSSKTIICFLKWVHLEGGVVKFYSLNTAKSVKEGQDA
jgi:hypothetical protein